MFRHNVVKWTKPLKVKDEKKLSPAILGPWAVSCNVLTSVTKASLPLGAAVWSQGDLFKVHKLDSDILHMIYPGEDMSRICTEKN